MDSCTGKQTRLTEHREDNTNKLMSEITVSISSLTFRRLPSIQARCNGDSPFSFRWKSHNSNQYCSTINIAQCSCPRCHFTWATWIRQKVTNTNHLQRH